ncbi:MAG: ECF transporter S component [Clostridiales bacterium]|nr:ECF transporter S component [Clostridiales bacterium]
MQRTSKLILSALFIAIGVLLPTALSHYFGRQVGTIFSPMHLPILLCGLICGWKYGLAVGIITPLLSSSVTGMPPLIPIGIAMALELATYGAVAGALRQIDVYIALIVAMISGRVVYQITQMSLAGVNIGWFKAFLVEEFVTQWPGILITLVLVPLIMRLIPRRL